MYVSVGRVEDNRVGEGAPRARSYIREDNGHKDSLSQPAINAPVTVCPGTQDA